MKTLMKLLMEHSYLADQMAQEKDHMPDLDDRHTASPLSNVFPPRPVSIGCYTGGLSAGLIHFRT
jgi:hypothetical protein